MWTVLKGLLAHRSRLLRTAAAVALAVSLVSGTFVLTDTIDAAFDRASTSSAQIDVVVRASAQFTAQATTLPERETLPESLLDTIAAIPGVQKVWGQVMGFAGLVDKDGKAINPSGLPTVGTSFSPGDTLVAGRAPAGPGEVVIDDVTMAKDGFQLGDQIKILFQGLVREFTIAGVRKVNDLLASTTASFDLETAQQLLGEAGTLDAIPVKAEPGVSPELMRARIGAVLPERYEVVTYDQAAREAQESWTKALGFLTTALLMFAAVALLVGAFIIFNTFSILVAQRTRELGLLRAVGASRRHLVTSVLAEALLVGVVASVRRHRAGPGRGPRPARHHAHDRLRAAVGAGGVPGPHRRPGPGRRGGRHRGRRHHPRPPGHQGLAHGRHPGPHRRGAGGDRPAHGRRRERHRRRPGRPLHRPVRAGADAAAGHRPGLGRHPRRHRHAHPARRQPRRPGCSASPWSASSASPPSSAGRTPCATPAARRPPPPPS